MVRVAFGIIFLILIIALILAGVASYRSEKPIGKNVFWLEMALIAPVFGNLLIIVSTKRLLTLIGCYCYYIGINCTVLAIIEFTKKYCRTTDYRYRRKRSVPVWIYVLLIADMLQLALNPVFGHAFKLEEITAYGSPYFRMIPLAGQYFHRIVAYGIVVLLIAVYIATIIGMSRINREKYAVILLSILIATVWQSVYIFSRAPVDRSMIGFAVFGILIYYFAMHYRSVRLLDQMLADIISDMRNAIFLFDETGECIWTNIPGQKLTGVNENTYEARDALRELFGEYEELEEKKTATYTIGFDSETSCFTLERGVFKDNKGKSTGSFLNVRDITAEQKRMEREMYDATHDALTELYTKEFLLQRIGELLKTSKKEEYLIGFIDVRDFKIVNDIFGKEFGDYALKCIADWIRERVPEDSIYGRLIGDTFGICRPKNTFDLQKVEEELSNFMIVKGNAEHHLTIHVGFCEITSVDTDISILFDRAHLAVTSLKEDGSKHVAFYDSKVRDKAKRSKEISSQLHNAIELGQVMPYLQPIADRDGNIVGAEALVRWFNPDKGFMSPAEFIPVFEENGMIVDVDKHMWQRACEILFIWKDKYPDIFISVNISPKDFYLTDVYGVITDLVETYGIDSRNLRIEVTETSMMTDAEDKMEILQKFRDKGFIVEMDDFGSGYSSLNMLKDMPVDVLKIDMNFLGKSKDGYRANTIVKNVINLSEDLGIASLTEGVETEEQFDMLAEMGCKLFQGYYFSKPLTREEFERMIEDV